MASHTQLQPEVFSLLRQHGSFRGRVRWLQQGVADSSKTLLAWASIAVRKLEPCIPSQSSQQNQQLPWFSKVDLPPPLDRNVTALVSSASWLSRVGPSGQVQILPRKVLMNQERAAQAISHPRC